MPYCRISIIRWKGSWSWWCRSPRRSDGTRHIGEAGAAARVLAGAALPHPPQGHRQRGLNAGLSELLQQDAQTEHVARGKHWPRHLHLRRHPAALSAEPFPGEVVLLARLQAEVPCDTPSAARPPQVDDVQHGAVHAARDYDVISL
ncbi:hypothetical protein E2C01_056059 [Portunus trituberculatus]|uniref:Uncharacterized protein n=1 Tax=Portunus trituberculatus TaxID=210409 RepID=A0A5B7GPC1_PORTR|nr:hypothetical protein [Portunus trituberculatus]